MKLFKQLIKIVGILVVLVVFNFSISYSGGAVKLFDRSGAPQGLYITNGQIVARDSDSAFIEEGIYFRTGFQKDVANAGTAILAFTVPDSTTRIHFYPTVDGESEFNVIFYENLTSITGGSSVTVLNVDRESTNISIVTLVSDPTINTTGATLLGNVVFGSGKSSGGAAGPENKWVLKRNTLYAIVVTNQTTSNNEINIRFSWTENL